MGPARDLDLAAEHLRHGRTAAALKLCDRTLRTDPTHADALALRGVGLFLEGSHAAAIEAFQTCLRLAPHDGGTWVNLGNALQALGRHEDSIDAFRQALANACPNVAGCLYNLGNALSDLKRHGEAAHAYRQALELRPTHGWTINNLALALRELGSQSGERALLEESLQLYGRLGPDFPGIAESLERAEQALARWLLNDGRGADAAAVVRRRADGVAPVVLRRAPSLWRSEGILPVEWWDDCRVLPGDKEWFVIDGAAGLHLDDMANTNPEVSRYIPVLGRDSALAWVAEPRIRLDRAVLLGSSRNHYHWLLDYLPRLEALLARRDDWRDIPLLMNDAPTDVQRDTLRMLGLEDHPRITVPDDGVVAVDRLLVTPVGASASAPRPAAVAWLRSALGAAKSGSSGPRRLYVSRADAAVRRVVNEPDVARALGRIGFTRIVPSTLTLAEQIAVFAKAEVIVAPHGAGLTNMVFAPPGARIIELLAGRADLSFFRILAATCGHRWERLICASAVPEQQERGSRVENHDMRVQVGDLVRAIGR